MAPVFMLEFLFLALLIGIILLIFALYVMFNLLLSLPRLKKGS
jgi:predicted membrane protein